MPRKKVVIPPEPPNWRISESMKWNGRSIEKGTELSISGERGRFRFIRLVQVVGEPHGEVMAEWIDVVGGGTKRRPDMTRSFRPYRIKTVHRINKTRENVK